MTWIRIRLILTSKEVLSVKGEDLLFLFMQGFPLPSSINPNPFFIRRGFDLHSKPLCPLQGRGLTAPPVALTLR